MPRQAGLDAPGTLHHVIVRGIEKRKIVDDTTGGIFLINMTLRFELNLHQAVMLI